MRLVIRQSGGTVEERDFEKGPVYIGRQMGNTIVIPDLQVSRQHAVLFTDPEGNWIVEDLDSTNKTLLNETAIHKSRLRDGDAIQIGPATIEVHLEEAIVVDFSGTESATEGSAPGVAEESGAAVEATEDSIPAIEAAQMSGPGEAEPVVTAASESVPEAAEAAEHGPEAADHMQDTMVAAPHGLVTVHRTIDAKEGEPIQMPARRFGELDQAVSSFCQARDLRGLHRSILQIIVRQLRAYHAWAGLRKATAGVLDIEGGRDVATVVVKRDELVLPQTIDEALEKGTYQLVPQLPRQIGKGRIRSVIVAPVLRSSGCFGVLYAENSTDHEHYSREDLDYLILLSILVAAVVEKV